jgi:predicted AAA+ superfamily ATPase
MKNVLLTTYRRLIATVPADTHRSLFHEIDLDNRLIGLIGPRGTGKTTLMLQLIVERVNDPDRCIYLSLDNILFARQSLFEFVIEMYEVEGIRAFFLDEVHKYPGWDQELKNLYDSVPDIRLVFSGSSSIDLIQGSWDLSRRAVVYRLPGLSFREYLHFCGIAAGDPIPYASPLADKARHQGETGTIEAIRGHFKRYLTSGYYPFFLEGEDSYRQKLFRIVEKTVFEDISSFYRLKTENLIHFKRILTYLATLPPGELNRNSLAKHIELDYKTVQTYLHILHETGLVTILTSGRGGSAVLKAREKLYLENTNLYEAIADQTGYRATQGSIREVFLLSMLRNSGSPVFFSSTGYFDVGDVAFEVDGKNKNARQLQAAAGASFLVKDDILYGRRNEIPPE